MQVGKRAHAEAKTACASTFPAVFAQSAMQIQVPESLKLDHGSNIKVNNVVALSMSTDIFMSVLCTTMELLINIHVHRRDLGLLPCSPEKTSNF